MPPSIVFVQVGTPEALTLKNSPVEFVASQAPATVDSKPLVVLPKSTPFKVKVD